MRSNVRGVDWVTGELKQKRPTGVSLKLDYRIILRIFQLLRESR